MLMRKAVWICGFAVILSFGLGTLHGETEKNEKSGETVKPLAAESPAAAAPAEPKPVGRILPLPAGVDKRLAKRLEEFLRVYGEVSVDVGRRLVFVQSQPRYVPQIEALIAEFDHGPGSGFLVRLVWLQDGLEDGGQVPADLEPVVAHLKTLGLGEVGKVGQLVLRVSNGDDFNAATYPQLDLDSAHLTFHGSVSADASEIVEIKVSVQAGVATPRRTTRRSGSSGGSVASVQTTARLKVSSPAILSVTPYGSGSAVFVLEVIAAP